MKKIILAEKRNNENGREELFYKESQRYNMSDCAFINVYSPYEIIEDGGKEYIVSSNCKTDFKEGYRGFIDSNLGLHSHYISPFEIENLLFDALKVNLNDKKDILRFCNNYGVLGEIRQKNTFDKYELTGVNECGAFESLDFFKREMEELQECFSLYLMTEMNDETKLKKYRKKQIERRIAEIDKDIQEYQIRMHSDVEMFSDLYLKSLKGFKDHYLKEINNFPSKEEMIRNAKTSLVGEINKKLPNVFLSLQLTQNLELIEGITSYTLIGSLYYQLYQHIVRGNEFNTCKYCGNYFVPRKRDSNFCPPEKANEHSKCANAYNAMTRRAREWHFKRNLSPEEIQKKIKKPKKRTLSEINHWLDSYKGNLN
ncbi:hypothetical protein LKL81_26085 [Bacillus paranthracis]|uniref:hypothetical protein n=1 Tax=Bacillus paranthracis TaxID=2026186 RepID=UPI001E537032|nr:hypothetical protein [Bacillus paranthracis]MCC2430684.1 hypothetical protein [Bacillus paranthracis]